MRDVERRRRGVEQLDARQVECLFELLVRGAVEAYSASRVRKSPPAL
jgi:hypothetical protein